MASTGTWDAPGPPRTGGCHCATAKFAVACRCAQVVREFGRDNPELDKSYANKESSR